MKNRARRYAVRMCSMTSGMACGKLLRGERKRKLQIFEKEWLYT